MEKILFFLLTLYTVCYSVHLPETVERPDFECQGTSAGFGISGSRLIHYERLKMRYDGCTFVHGNLEITNLDDPNIEYDLGFLSKIRYVTGYVIIGLVSEIDQIKLTSLEMIRGSRTYRILEEDYSLIVVLTARYHSSHIGLRELHLPALREIVAGNVLFEGNPALCYVNTIPWDKLTRDRTTTGNSVTFGDKAFNAHCPECPIECEYNNESRCWGGSPSLCSRHIDQGCDESCNGLCFERGTNGCCNEVCSVGCTGPTEYDCQVCRDYKAGEMCVSYCPENTYLERQICIPH